MKRVPLVDKNDSRFAGINGYEPEDEAELQTLIGCSTFEAAVQLCLTKQYLAVLGVNRSKKNPITAVADLQAFLDELVAKGHKFAAGRQAQDPIVAKLNSLRKELKDPNTTQARRDEIIKVLAALA